MPSPPSPGLFADLPGESRTRPAHSAPSARSSGEWINAHCDGGARGNPGPSGYGAVITDDAGHTLAELSEYLGHRTNNYAEYSGLLGCLAYALEHQHPRLRVVSDSELMVKQIQGKYQVKSPDLKPLFEEARRRIAQLAGFEISHALRHKNKAADTLANQAMDRGTDRGMRHDPARPGAPLPVAAPKPAAPKSVAPKSVAAKSGAPERSSVPGSTSPAAAPAAPAAAKADVMLRGFTRDGVIHLLGSASLPDGIFVKIIRE